MSLTHLSGRRGQQCRYCVSQSVLKGSAADVPAIARIPAAEIEGAVIAQFRVLLRQPEVVLGAWRAARASAPDMTEDEAPLALERLDPLWEELFPAEQARIIPAPNRVPREPRLQHPRVRASRRLPAAG